MRLNLLEPPQVAVDSKVRATWEAGHLAGGVASSDLYSLYHSTTWWDHLVATRDARKLRLGVFTAADNSLAAAIPLESRKISLPFQFGGRGPAAIPFRVMSAVTVDPLLRLAPGDSALILNSLATSAPGHHGFYVKSICLETPYWAELAPQPTLDDSFIYIVDGARPLYSIALPGTFDEYLKKFSGKTRNTLRRKVKLLREEGQGKLTLTRISSPDDVPEFLDAVRIVGKRSWKKRGSGWSHIAGQEGFDHVNDVAARGFLRSYVLRVNDIPCAFVNGYQYGGVYHYADLAYDESLAKFSPGLVLLFLLIEDLFFQNQPQQLNFGTGYADYKRQFANEAVQDASILVLRRTFANRMRVGVHSGFQSLKELLRRRLRKDRPADHDSQSKSEPHQLTHPSRIDGASSTPAAENVNSGHA